jgi:hypothetical protein
VPADNFSARWTGTVRAEVSGAFRFRTVSDDGVRLWVNGQLLVDRWTDHAPTTDDSVVMNLVAGQRYDVRLEYYERAGSAALRLLWTPPGQSKRVISAESLGTPYQKEGDRAGGVESTGRHEGAGPYCIFGAGWWRLRRCRR